ncbi:hypothetical protein MYX07_05700 [Patescibacteria group bacterium AH-259-L07]|nr:hypothetical protein [Patescibacteria group bacterium AH-259-L07]
MEVVYYFDKNLGVSPVKKYFEQYISTNKTSAEKRDYNYNIIASIDEKINYIREEHDGRAIPPIAKPLKGYKFFEIKHRKNEDTVIRVLCCRHKNKMVLLNAFEKPDHYKTRKEKRKIQRYLNKTDEYYNNFILNPNNYEEYE